MLSKMSFFIKKIVNPAALHEALLQKKEEKALELINNKFQLNYIYAGYNPLQLSLLYEMYKCTIELLERKVNPNSFYLDSNEKTIQPYISGYSSEHDLGSIKLLALYGASIDGVKFNTKNIHLKDLILQMNEIHRQRISLESLLEKTSGSNERNDLYSRLAHLWLSVSKNETNAIYKTFYLTKAKECQIAQLKTDSTMTTASNTPESSDHFPNDDENISLLNGIKIKRN